jgi:hypothetical protein
MRGFFVTDRNTKKYGPTKTRYIVQIKHHILGQWEKSGEKWRSKTIEAIEPVVVSDQHRIDIREKYSRKFNKGSALFCS